MKISGLRKLSFRIPAQIFVVILAAMTAICVVLSLLLSSYADGAEKDKIKATAINNSNIAAQYLDNMQSQSKALALAFSQFEGMDAGTIDKLTKDILLSALKDDAIFSAYVAWEPNSYVPDTPDGLSYYAFRDGSSVKMDVLNDYASYNTGEYYAVTKSTLKPHVTEPYSYDLTTGQTVWLITISNPIMNDAGKFVGVANCDILTDTVNNLAYDTGNYKTSYSYILTGNAAYIADTFDKSKMGSAYSEETSQKQHILDITTGGQESLFEDNDSQHGGIVYTIHEPLHIKDMDQVWSSAFVVTKSEALRQSSYILYMIIAISAAGVILLFLLSLLFLNRGLKPIGKIMDFARDMRDGNLHGAITVKSKDELGELAELFRETCASIRNYIADISEILGQISDGNLAVDVSHEYAGDFAPIKKALIAIIQSLNATLSEISLSTQQVALGADQVSAGAQTLSQGATEQASSIEQLSASIRQVSQQVNENATNVKTANDYVYQSGASLQTSEGHMKSMLDAMTQINNSSNEISKIIKVIDDIAFQTNILALNAAVEAARAGAAGKGFAVVADEVRNLASKSADAAKNTTGLIENTIAHVDKGVKIATESAQSLEDVAEKSSKVLDTMQMIAKASEDQALAITQITQGIDQISAVVQTNSATAEESAATAEELSAQASTLKNQISVYRLK